MLPRHAWKCQTWALTQTCRQYSATLPPSSPSDWTPRPVFQRRHLHTIFYSQGTARQGRLKVNVDTRVVVVVENIFRHETVSLSPYNTSLTALTSHRYLDPQPDSLLTESFRVGHFIYLSITIIMNILHVNFKVLPAGVDRRTYFTGDPEITVSPLYVFG